MMANWVLPTSCQKPATFGEFSRPKRWRLGYPFSWLNRVLSLETTRILRIHKTRQRKLGTSLLHCTTRVVDILGEWPMLRKEHATSEYRSTKNRVSARGPAWHRSLRTRARG